MRVLFGLALATSAILLASCAQESIPGGPGATATNGTVEPAPSAGPTAPATDQPAATPADNAAPADTTDSTDNTFTLKVPSTSTGIARGSAEDVSLSIDRGSAFDQAVTLKFEAPPGFKMNPDNPKLEAGTNKVTVGVEVAEDAPLGEHQIRVIATPESGRAVQLPMVIEVEEKS